MSGEEALRDIKGYAAANRIRLSRHVRERMPERGATYEDIRHALMTATACKPETGDKWFVGGGIDLDDEPLNVVVVLEGEVFVVTILG